MADLKKKLNMILEDLEKNIKNKDDLEYVKSQVYNISLIFLDEVDKITELSFDRLNVMIDREKDLSKKITRMEKIIDNLEKEVFVSDDSDFEIVCPYCNAEFIQDLEAGLEQEIKCPECGNTIELDWHDDCCGDDCCSGECSCDECDDCDDCDSCDDYGDEDEDEDDNEDM